MNNQKKKIYFMTKRPLLHTLYSAKVPQQQTNKKNKKNDNAFNDNSEKKNSSQNNRLQQYKASQKLQQKAA